MPRKNLLIAGALMLFAVPGQGQWRSNSAPVLETPILQQSETNPGRKSVFLAVAASVVMPGLGEWYAGNFNESGRFSLGTEGVLWVTYAGLRLHSTWVRDDARLFGSQMAGVSFAGKDTDFEVNVGNFMTVEEYNDAKSTGRESDKMYTDPAYAWTWTSEAARQRFKDQRIRSDRIKESSKFVLAGMAVNRIISAFAAGRGAAAANRARAAGRMGYRHERRDRRCGHAGTDAHVSTALVARAVRFGLWVMTNWKLTLEYDGTDFSGWQIQPNGRTVQEELEKGLTRISGASVRVAGGGRTDAGVHATGQVATVELEKEFDPELLKRSLNGVLPEDVAVLKAEVCEGLSRSLQRKLEELSVFDRPATNGAQTPIRMGMRLPPGS